MNILWLTWKDRKHPQSGGAEMVNEELAKRLVKNGHQIIFLVGRFKGAKSEEIISGYKIIRLGNRFSCYWRVYRYYKKNLIGWPDLVIEEINTIPFLTRFYVKEKKILFIHQLCCEIWFYEMFFPLNILGYFLEIAYLHLLNDQKTITVSKSAKNDLIRFSFTSKNIGLISEGVVIEAIKNLKMEKFAQSTILSLGSIRPMKQTDHVVKAFEIAKKKIKDLQLIVAGDATGRYGQKVIRQINCSLYNNSIQFLGKVDLAKKKELMQKSHLIGVTSIKEGWGLIVTEAASQGTPAVVYNVDGLRDSVKNNKTGIICQENTPENLAENIIKLLNNRKKYHNLRKNAWQWSKEINFENSYQDFINVIGVKK